MLLGIQNRSIFSIHPTRYDTGAQGKNIPFKLHVISKEVDDIIQMASRSSKSMTLLRTLALLKWSEILKVVNAESHKLIKDTDKNMTATISDACLVNRMKNT